MRTSVLRMRLTEQEKEEIHAHALAAKLSDSDYMRQSLGLEVNRKPPGRPRRLLQHLERQEARHDVEPGNAGLDGLRRRLKT